MGRTDAREIGQRRGVTVLFFGQPAIQNDAFGTLLLDDVTFASLAEIQDAAKAYIFAYWNNTQSDAPRRTIALGTSNSGSNVTRAQGEAWAQLVQSVDSYVRIEGFSSRIAVLGANNIELGFNSYDVTIEWVNGYIGTTTRPFLNVGACEGCPDRLNPDRVPNNGWTVANIWEVSDGPQRVALPQIYRTDGVSARQWQYVSKQKYLTTGDDIVFNGAFTQQRACQDRPACEGTDNTPENGWTQFWLELNNDADTTQPFLSNLTDVRWEL